MKAVKSPLEGNFDGFIVRPAASDVKGRLPGSWIAPTVDIASGAGRLLLKLLKITVNVEGY